MTPTQKAAMTAALEALENATTYGSLTGAEWVFDAVDNAITALRAALAETAEPVAGWKLVPVEPTEAMLKAALDADPPVSMPHWTDVFRARWSAMLNTTPQPPAPAVQEPKAGPEVFAGRVTFTTTSVTSACAGNGGGGQAKAPAVELTDAELFDAIEADLANKFWSARRAFEQDLFLTAGRAAIAAHEAKKGQQ